MSEDPVEAPDDTAARIAVGPALDSASMALSVVLESLPPAERVVFVLNEVFGYQPAEIAGILGRHPGAVRQLAHRAREQVRARRPQCPADPRLQQQAAEPFAAAPVDDPSTRMGLPTPDVPLPPESAEESGPRRITHQTP